VELKRRATGEREELNFEDALARVAADVRRFRAQRRRALPAVRKSDRFTSVIAIFSFLGIMLGVATLIIVMSVMGGFRQELLGRILGLNGHMGIYSAERGNLRDFDAIAERVRRVPGVLAATPIVEGQVLLTGEGASATGGLARGIRPDDLRAKSIIAGNIRAGSLNDFGGDDVVAIGTRLAFRLGLNLGDRITLVSPQGGPP
jgi:lipoprotein-releasing system permease protein